MPKIMLLTKVENVRQVHHTEDELFLIGDIVGIASDSGKLGRIDDFPFSIKVSDMKGWNIREEGVII